MFNFLNNDNNKPSSHNSNNNSNQTSETAALSSNAATINNQPQTSSSLSVMTAPPWYANELYYNRRSDGDYEYIFCDDDDDGNSISEDAEFNDDDNDNNENMEKIVIGVCAMAKKANSKPMGEILDRLRKYELLEVKIFDEDVILNKPIEEWPRCDCLISFYSHDFPLKKAEDYAKKYNPFLINDLEKQWDLMDRRKVYELLKEAGIEQPRYAIKMKDDNKTLIEQEDQIEIDGQVFTKPFVEKPVNADDHNIYIYFPSSVGGGSQRLFRKVQDRSSQYFHENHIRRNGSFIYEEFMPTDGTDVKVYTVGAEYAHAEARKSPALDGIVERDHNNKEIRYPVMLRTEEKFLARKIVLAFKQLICGFDLLRANGKSYVCDVNGFSFVKNSTKYYDDCSSILANIILKEIAPLRHIPYSPICYEADERPIVPTTFGTMMELRCVIAVMRHGDRTPKQKMKMEVKNKLFFDFFEKYDGMKSNQLKIKRPSQLTEILDIARKLIQECNERATETLPSKETKSKLLQLKSVLEMYGHFSGINRKVQFKYQPNGKPKSSGATTTSSDEDMTDVETSPSLLLILKWGGELTAYGKAQAKDLGTEFRKLYPGAENVTNKLDNGFLRLHSTYRNDLKIYASDEGRVQMTAAAFAKGLLALEGELAPILVQMVKSANTNGLLDNDNMSAKWQHEVKSKLQEYLNVNRNLTEEDLEKIDPTNNNSLKALLRYIRNPVEVCLKVNQYIKEITNQIRNKMTDGKSYNLKLYHDESWELCLRRWAKLEKDFLDKKTNQFDVSKIPDIYDSIKYDLIHNKEILNFEKALDFYKTAKALADIFVPLEYGRNVDEKLRIAQGIVTPLLRKIRADIKSSLTGLWNEDNKDTEMSNKLDPKYSNGILTPERHVKTRLYFTSESHIYSFLTVLKYGNLFESNQDEQWNRSLNYLNTIPELNYLTQIVIMLYEDPNVSEISGKRFHLELHFSPGSYTEFDDPPAMSTIASASMVETTSLNKSESESMHLSDIERSNDSTDSYCGNSNNNKHELYSSSPKSAKMMCYAPQQHHHHQYYIRPASTKTRRISHRSLNSTPPHTPTQEMLAAAISNSEKQQQQQHQQKPSISAAAGLIEEESKPRSFEDEHHRNRIMKVRTINYDKAPYNHYYTFHGSGNTSQSYMSINQVFKNRFMIGGTHTSHSAGVASDSAATNSSPNLNQTLIGKKKRSSGLVCQDLIKVRYMRQLETLHNDLTFDIIDNFLNRIINDTERLALSATSPPSTIQRNDQTSSNTHESQTTSTSTSVNLPSRFQGRMTGLSANLSRFFLPAEEKIDEEKQ